jgi:hypothetical protein
VAGLTRSWAARSRIVGSRSAAARLPSAIAASIFAAMVAAPAPGPICGTGAGGTGVAALFAASIAVGAGECAHTTALIPLAADLAPPELRGRYLAAMGFSWWIGLAVAPALGAQLLARSPDAAFGAGAAVAAAAAASALTLERRLPAGAVLTPRPLP